MLSQQNSLITKYKLLQLLQDCTAINALNSGYMQLVPNKPFLVKKTTKEMRRN